MSMDWLQLVHGTTKSTTTPPFRTGDEVRVWYRILEQGKERFGQFEGVVIRFRGSGGTRTFTVRRVTHGEGVERVFPLDAKIISRIEVLRKGSVKRSRLYFLRTVIGKNRLTTVAADNTADSAPVGQDTTDAQRLGEKSEDAVAAAGTSQEGTPPHA